MDEAQKNHNVTVREAYERRIKIDPTQGMTANKELATQTVSQFLAAKQIYIKEQIQKLNIVPQKITETNSATQSQNVSSLGNNLSQMSSNNSDMRRNMASVSPTVIISQQMNTNKNTTRSAPASQPNVNPMLG
jgi:predicted metal-dependent hydrolase